MPKKFAMRLIMFLCRSKLSILIIDKKLFCVYVYCGSIYVLKHIYVRQLFYKLINFTYGNNSIY
ncbi:Hypothetical protein ERWE_CDS_00870 [Ehrlichia ruminantium str. Welgevonden]|uniref:Uncharacterized protein n=1 Tax=Ehrlichia ruminantium (strain Welgevonden) TaxID=254945 RepID=A0A0H3M0C5_EHRRW|nr:Hypothetical protein ERWE_CDS_00870 [Ehrlichia ruminantium str. Welgevonden]